MENIIATVENGAGRAYPPMENEGGTMENRDHRRKKGHHGKQEDTKRKNPT